MCVAWQVCRIEQSRSQSGAPATQNDSQCTQRHCRIRSKRCQDKTVTACISLSTTHISTYAPAQANRHTHTQTPAQTDPDAFSDTVSSFSRLSAAMGPSYCVFSEPGFFKENSHPMKYHTTEVMPPPSPTSMLPSEFCVWWPSKKKQPFLLMMLGTSDHNIEVGGCGGKQGISVVSCGWLFFFFLRTWYVGYYGNVVEK